MQEWIINNGLFLFIFGQEILSDEIKVSTKGAIEINYVRNLDVEVIGGVKINVGKNWDVLFR